MSKEDKAFLPFPEYGSAITALSKFGDHDSMGILVNNLPDHEKLVKSRCSQLQNFKFNSTKGIKTISVSDFFKSSGLPTQRQIKEIIASTTRINDFMKMKIDNHSVLVSKESDRVVMLYYEGDAIFLKKFKLILDDTFCKKLEKLFGKKRITIYAPGIYYADSCTSSVIKRVKVKTLPFCLFT